MKKMTTFILCAMMVLSLTACSSTKQTEVTQNSDRNNSVQIPSPFTECKTMAEAIELAGFNMTVPDTIDGYTKRMIQATSASEETSMIEVIYQKENEDTSSLRIRKASGSEDISGDYTNYPESTTVTVGEIQVTMKGTNDQVSLATWANDGYTYSIGIYNYDSSDNNGISSADMSAIISSVQ